MRAVLGCRQVPISALEADQFEALFTHLIAMLGDAINHAESDGTYPSRSKLPAGYG